MRDLSRRTVLQVSSASPALVGLSAYSRGHPPERLFHAGMAWLFVVIAVAGFVPRSLAIIGGTMPNPPLVVHLRAAVMASRVAFEFVWGTDWWRDFGPKLVGAA